MDKEECYVEPAGMVQAGIKIIDGEFGIASCGKENLPQWVTSLGKAEENVFFYFHQRDLIVLNEDNVNYEFNLEIACNYLKFDNETKKEFMQHAKSIRQATYNFLRCLNYVGRIRRKLYRSMERKAGALNAAD